ncbi:MAG: protein ImuB [Verrucomicrobiales bacterium]|jgi:protein ImuB
MYGVIHIPNFFLQSQLRAQPELAKHPIALLEEAETASRKGRGKARIIQATETAMAHGVEIGTTATQGQARCGGLRLLYRSETAEREAQDILLNAAESWTADFEATTAGVCTLDLFANSQALSQPQRLGRKMVDFFATHQLSSSIGFAHHPDLALLVARQAAPIMVVDDKSESLERFLADLPVQVLGPSVDFLEVLRLWGIRTLGELIALPMSELTERLGPEAVTLLARSRGKSRRLLKLERAPAVFIRQMEFEHGVEMLEPLLFVMRRMLETLSARLAAIHLVAGELILTLRFADDVTHQHNFRVPDPSREVELLFRILHTHLEEFTAEAPIVALTLEVKPSRQRTHQFDLFRSSLRDPNRFSETLARLEALLGSNRVGTPAPLPVHRPDAFVMKPFSEAMDDSANRRKKKRKLSPIEEAFKAKLQAERLGLPLRRFRPPQPITVVTEWDRPSAILSGSLRGIVTQARGPWLQSGDWWQKDHWSQKEWDVQHEDGGLYRIAEIRKNEWILAGIYG